MSFGRPRVLVSNPSGKSVLIESYDEPTSKRKKLGGQSNRKNKTPRTTTFQVKGSLQQAPVVEPSAGPSRNPNSQPSVPMPSESAGDDESLLDGGEDGREEEGQEKTTGSQKQVRRLLKLILFAHHHFPSRTPIITSDSGRKNQLKHICTPCTTVARPLLLHFVNFARRQPKPFTNAFLVWASPLLVTLVS